MSSAFRRAAASAALAGGPPGAGAPHEAQGQGTDALVALPEHDDPQGDRLVPRILYSPQLALMPFVIMRELVAGVRVRRCGRSRAPPS